MKKYKEIALWYGLRDKARKNHEEEYLQPGIENFLELIEELEIDQDRAHYYLKKWASEGLWDSGVTVRGGWFTPKAEEKKPTLQRGFIEK